MEYNFLSFHVTIIILILLILRKAVDTTFETFISIIFKFMYLLPFRIGC